MKIRRQRAADFSTATILEYGPPGAGKTTMGCSAGTVDNRLIMNCEGGTKAQLGDIVEINSLQTLNGVLDYLEKGDHPYEYLVLDGLDALYHTIFEESKSGKNAKDRRLAHVDPSYNLTQALRRFAALKCVKIIIAHAKITVDDKGFTNVTINMPPAVRLVIEGLVDIGIYCWRSVKSGKYLFIADMFEHGRGMSWGKDRSGKLGAVVRTQNWATIEQALGLEPPKPKDNE